jgi:hypothetical protein
MICEPPYYPNCPFCGANPQVDIGGLTLTPIAAGSVMLDEVRCGTCKKLVATIPAVNGCERRMAADGA